MTPEEKAKEIFDKLSWAMVPDGLSVRNAYIIKHAKQCAIICIEQIIEAFKQADGNQECTTIHIMHHWEEVLECLKHKQ